MQIDLEPEEWRREDDKPQKPKSAYDGYDFIAGLAVSAFVVWFVFSGYQSALNEWIRSLIFG